jgi:hypothetical protein
VAKSAPVAQRYVVDTGLEWAAALYQQARMPARREEVQPMDPKLLSDALKLLETLEARYREDGAP